MSSWCQAMHLTLSGTPSITNGSASILFRSYSRSFFSYPAWTHSIHLSLQAWLKPYGSASRAAQYLANS